MADTPAIKQNIDDEKIDDMSIREIEEKLRSEDLTIQQEAYLLHLLHVQALRKKLEKEAAELKERQEKIKFIHDILRDINSAMDDKGGLDISKVPGLEDKLKKAKEMGIALPDISKKKLEPNACKRLIENLDSATTDWEKEDAMQMRKIQNYYTESEQSILIAKNTMTSLDKPIRQMIAGIK